MTSTRSALRAASLLCLVAAATALPRASPRAALPAYSRVGCYSGTVNGTRALNSASTASNSMTVETCAVFCDGYRYFGLEYGRECFW